VPKGEGQNKLKWARFQTKAGKNSNSAIVHCLCLAPPSGIALTLTMEETEGIRMGWWSRKTALFTFFTSECPKKPKRGGKTDQLPRISPLAQDTWHYGPHAPVELSPSAHISVSEHHTGLYLQPEKEFRVYPGALIHFEKRREKWHIEKMKEPIRSWANSDQRDVKSQGSQGKTRVH